VRGGAATAPTHGLGLWDGGTRTAPPRSVALADRRTVLLAAVAGRLLAFAVAFGSNYWLGARLRHNQLAGLLDHRKVHRS